MAKIGTLSLVLHSHIPYVLGHGRWPHGTDWLCEVAAETYVPILEALYGLAEDGVKAPITVSLTPVLADQLAAPEFGPEFTDYLSQKQQIARDNAKDFSKTGEQHLGWLAETWVGYYERIRQRFEERYGSNLIGAFRKLQEAGAVEVMTSAATHGYMPLLGFDTCVQAQVYLGAETYRQHFGRQPLGFWLPECAYRPRYQWRSPIAGAEAPSTLRKGIEEFLAEAGLHYFIVDSHMLSGGEARGVYIDRFRALRRLWEIAPGEVKRWEGKPGSIHAAHFAVSGAGAEKPVAFLCRDERTGFQVWSGEWGYPGDGWYMEFHKKHWPGGLRYWRVTSSDRDLGSKRSYEPSQVDARIDEHARHFLHIVKEELARENVPEGSGVLCAPFDAELFGHWWFEGPEFLAKLLRYAAQDEQLEVASCSQYIREHPPQAAVVLPEGSWGKGGFHWVWLNDRTLWTWEKIHAAEEHMQELAGRYAQTADAKVRSILEQMARELLLLESSDWQFIISAYNAADYAEKRVSEHYKSFEKLRAMLPKALAGRLEREDEETLHELRSRDSVFPKLDLQWWAKLSSPP